MRPGQGPQCLRVREDPGDLPGVLSEEPESPIPETGTLHRGHWAEGSFLPGLLQALDMIWSWLIECLVYAQCVDYHSSESYF